MQSDLDRELDEFLGEVRVVLSAVTVLFAFLLTVPFTARFEQLTLITGAGYFVAFITTGTASVLLLGETGYHRLRASPTTSKGCCGLRRARPSPRSGTAPLNCAGASLQWGFLPGHHLGIVLAGLRLHR